MVSAGRPFPALPPVVERRHLVGGQRRELRRTTFRLPVVRLLTWSVVRACRLMLFRSVVNAFRGRGQGLDTWSVVRAVGLAAATDVSDGGRQVCSAGRCWTGHDAPWSRAAVVSPVSMATQLVAGQRGDLVGVPAAFQGPTPAVVRPSAGRNSVVRAADLRSCDGEPGRSWSSGGLIGPASAVVAI